MILLDLTGKAELAEKMAEKLTPADLREKFMNAYAEIINHPENHKKFRLEVGMPAPPKSCGMQGTLVHQLQFR